jgi:hypothetical protein
MAEILTVVLIANALFLLAVNAFILFARMTGRERLAREVARTLSPYMWPLRLSGEDGRAESTSRNRRRHGH